MTTREQRRIAAVKIHDSHRHGPNYAPNEGPVNGKEFTPEFIEEIRKILDVKLDQLPEIVGLLFSEFNICTPNRNDVFVTVTKNRIKEESAEKEARKAADFNNQGIEEFNAQNYEEALAKFQAAINVNPKEEGFQRNKACALFQLEKYQEALDAVELSLAIDQNCQDAKDLKEKIENRIKEEFAEKEARKADDFNNQGTEAKNHEEALAKFQAAININSKDKVFQSNKAQALFYLGKNQEALEAVKLSLDIDQNYQHAKDLKEKLEILIKEESAEKEARKAIDFINQGIEELKAQNYEEALAKFQAAININPKEEGFQRNKALALFLLGKYQEALDAVELSLDIDQNCQPSQDLKEKIEIKIKEAEKIAAAEERAQKIAEIRAQNKAKSDKFILEYNQKKEQLEIEEKKLVYQKPIITTYLINDQKTQGSSNSFFDENSNEETKFAGENFIKTEKIAEVEL